MYSALIIDDEAKVRETLHQMLNIYCPNVEVIAEASGVESGYEAIAKYNPDVVFLDVQMYDGTGFDLLTRFESPSFQIIIVTAYCEYAIDAFRYSALDYLLKPIDSTDLIDAVERLSKTVNISENKTKFSALNANLQNPAEKGGKLVLRMLDEVVVVDIDSIVRCEANNNTTIFFFNNSPSIKVSRTLREYEDLLSNKGFFRCHQSHLINKKHLLKVARFPVPTAKMDDGSQIPVSVRKQGLIT